MALRYLMQPEGSSLLVQVLAEWHECYSTICYATLGPKQHYYCVGYVKLKPIQV